MNRAQTQIPVLSTNDTAGAAPSHLTATEPGSGTSPVASGLRCQHTEWALLGVPADSLSCQLSANSIGKHLGVTQVLGPL